MDSDDPERNLALSAIDAEAQVDDLLRPTYGMDFDAVPINMVSIAKHERDHKGEVELANLIELWAKHIETLLADNNALRRIATYPQVIVEHGKIIGHTYNPATHVAVPREPFEALMECLKRCDFDDLDCGRGIEEYAKAMLRASEEEEG